MKNTPILFGGEMVRAILAGRKTQTRRLLTIPHARKLGLDHVGNTYVVPDCGGADWDGTFEGGVLPWSPFGLAGDRLWVRECWNVMLPAPLTYWSVEKRKECTIYRAALEEAGITAPGDSIRWRPSIHMPRWASRITLEVTGVRVERLQDITEGDAKAEGLERREHFIRLWDSIQPKRGGMSFCDDPFVWVVSFRQVPPAR